MLGGYRCCSGLGTGEVHAAGSRGTEEAQDLPRKPCMVVRQQACHDLRQFVWEGLHELLHGQGGEATAGSDVPPHEGGQCIPCALAVHQSSCGLARAVQVS